MGTASPAVVDIFRCIESIEVGMDYCSLECNWGGICLQLYFVFLRSNPSLYSAKQSVAVYLK